MNILKYVKYVIFLVSERFKILVAMHSMFLQAIYGQNLTFVVMYRLFPTTPASA